MHAHTYIAYITSYSYYIHAFGFIRGQYHITSYNTHIYRVSTNKINALHICVDTLDMFICPT